MIIHRVKIPLQDIINRAVLASKKSNPNFDYAVDSIRIDNVTRDLILDISQGPIQPKDKVVPAS